MVIMFLLVHRNVLKWITGRPWILKVLALVALVYIGWGAINTAVAITFLLYHNVVDPLPIQRPWALVLQAHDDFAITAMLIVLFYLAARYFINRQVLRRFHVYITMGVAPTTIFWGPGLYWLYT